MFQEELASQVPDDLHVNERTLVEKSIITEKLIELQNEIEKYQQLNASLSTKDTKRNEVSIVRRISFMFYNLEIKKSKIASNFLISITIIWS